MNGAGAARNPAHRLVRQLAAIEVWSAVRRQETAARPGGVLTREQRLEWRRQQDAWEREAAALRERCSAPAPGRDLPRAVLIHRSAWLREKVQTGLAACGVQVVESVDDGARGCGAAIAEAPELVFLESGLPSMTGEQVVGRLRRCCPFTLLVAQVPYAEDCASMLAAGVAAAWPRQVPPAELVLQMHRLLNPAGD